MIIDIDLVCFKYKIKHCIMFVLGMLSTVYAYGEFCPLMLLDFCIVQMNRVDSTLANQKSIFGCALTSISMMVVSSNGPVTVIIKWM